MSRYSRPMNSSLYVRNVPDGTRTEELKSLFGKYGPISDVYIPLDYYTRRCRGFAYIQFEDARDADEALYHLDRVRFHGRELEVEFARGDRKTPHQMRSKDRYDDSPPRRGRSDRHRRRSDSRSPRRHRSRSRSHSRKHHSSKDQESSHRKKSVSRSPHSRSHSHSKSHSSDRNRKRDASRDREASKSRSGSVQREARDNGKASSSPERRQSGGGSPEYREGSDNDD